MFYGKNTANNNSIAVVFLKKVTQMYTLMTFTYLIKFSLISLEICKNKILFYHDVLGGQLPLNFTTTA